MRFARVRSAEDFYAVLGVRVDVEAAELRRAWRRMAVRWHPDRAGEAGAGMFAKLAEAYEVLSDPVLRAAYDARQGRGREKTSTTNRETREARAAAPGVMIERLCGHLATLVACGAAELEEDGSITLVLGAGEAQRGGMATIPMYVEVWCPACSKDAARGGTQDAAARARSARCVKCGGTRRVEELFSAWLAFQPGMRTGELLEPTVQMEGVVSPVRFRVRVRETR